MNGPGERGGRGVVALEHERVDLNVRITVLRARRFDSPYRRNFLQP